MIQRGTRSPVSGANSIVAARALECLVDFRLLAGGRDENEHHVGSGLLEIAVERGARILAQSRDVAHHDDATLGHHRRRAHQAAERFRIELGAGANVEIEVARGGIHGGRDELAHRLFLEEVVVPVEVVDALEFAALKRLPERAFEKRRHLVNIVSAGWSGA